MNQREMEKEIWRSLLTMAENFYDFDRSKYEQLKHGLNWEKARYDEGIPRRSQAVTPTQRRFDRALNRVVEIIGRKVR